MALQTFFATLLPALLLAENHAIDGASVVRELFGYLSMGKAILMEDNYRLLLS